jgi:hypothetical protein
MSGGAYEYVAAYNSGYPGSSGFTTDQLTTYAKYLDVYTSSTSTTYNRRILGDATGEMGPFAESSFPKSSWHSDYAHFANSTCSWFLRGGKVDSTIGAGQFAFSYDVGTAYAVAGSRLVLAA